MNKQWLINPYVPADKWLKVGFSAFISVFIVTFNNVGITLLLQRSTYYRDLFITFLVALLLIEFIKKTTAMLDQYLGWKSAQGKRLLLQIGIGIGGGGLLIYLISYLEYHLIDPEHVFGTDSFMKTEFPVAVLFMLVINGIYTCLSFYKYWQEELASEKLYAAKGEESGSYTPLICVNGQRNITVPIERVALICLQHDINWVTTFDRERYRHPKTLNEMMALLPVDKFFRANRQHIICISACHSYRSIEYGKIELLLNIPAQESIIISQKTAAAFRKWIEKGPVAIAKPAG